MERKPKIAILRWEEGHVPEILLQLERLPGNSTNPASYPFPVRMIHVPGACLETVVTNPSEKLLEDMIAISRKLIDEEGIRAITTSCGFNAIFQKKMAEALDVPVFTSSLMQVPFVQNVIGSGRTVGIITADSSSLTEEHLKACGITDDMRYAVFGLENASEWSKLFNSPDEPIDMAVVEQEILGTAVSAYESVPDMGAIVLECTDLPPFAEKISKATGLPVFDITTLVGYVGIALGEMKMY